MVLHYRLRFVYETDHSSARGTRSLKCDHLRELAPITIDDIALWRVDRARCHSRRGVAFGHDHRGARIYIYIYIAGHARLFELRVAKSSVGAIEPRLIDGKAIAR